MKLADKLKLTWFRTSHILGSVAYQITWWSGDIKDSQTICFSGDIGNNTDENPYQSLLKGRQYPASWVNHIVCESTYGETDRESGFESFEKRMEAWGSLLSTIYTREENPLVIIPAFSLQRVQEVVCDLVYLFGMFYGKFPSAFFRNQHSIEQLQNKDRSIAEIDGLMNGKGLHQDEKELLKGLFEETGPSTLSSKA